MINFDEFQKVEMKVGKIINAHKVENADRLLKLEVDFGDETRQVVSGIAESYNAEDLVGKSTIFVVNLEPRTIKGVESNGMIIAVHDDNNLPVLFFPEKEVSPGSQIS